MNYFTFQQLKDSVATYSFLPSLVTKSTISVLKSHVFSSHPKSWDYRMSILVSLLKSGMTNRSNSTKQIKLMQSFALPLIPSDITVNAKTITYSLNQIVEFEFNGKLNRDPNLPDVPFERTHSPLKTLNIELISLKTPIKKVILYLHGGAYFCGGLGTHRMMGCELARQTNATICMVDYRLAPEFPFPCALHDAFAAYLYLSDPHHSLFKSNLDLPFEDIIFMGDSAGGGLGISLMVYLKDYLMTFKMPIGGVFYSPWIDLSCSSASWISKINQDYLPTCPPLGYFYDMFDLEKGNPVMWYTAGKGENLVSAIGDEDSGIGLLDEQIEEAEAIKLVLHPLVSPYYASTKNLPSMLIQAGGVELIRDETEEFIMRIHKENPTRASQFRHELYAEMPHVFQTFFWTQSAILAHSRAGIFCKTLWDDLEVKSILFMDNLLVKSIVGVDQEVCEILVSESIEEAVDVLALHPFY